MLHALPKGSGQFLVAGEVNLQTDPTDSDSVSDMQNEGLELNALCVE